MSRGLTARLDDAADRYADGKLSCRSAGAHHCSAATADRRGRRRARPACPGGQRRDDGRTRRTGGPAPVEAALTVTQRRGVLETLGIGRLHRPGNPPGAGIRPGDRADRVEGGQGMSRRREGLADPAWFCRIVCEHGVIATLVHIKPSTQESDDAWQRMRTALFGRDPGHQHVHGGIALRMGGGHAEGKRRRRRHHHLLETGADGRRHPRFRCRRCQLDTGNLSDAMFQKIGSELRQAEVRSVSLAELTARLSRQ